MLYLHQHYLCWEMWFLSLICFIIRKRTLYLQFTVSTNHKTTVWLTVNEKRQDIDSNHDREQGAVIEMVFTWFSCHFYFCKIDEFNFSSFYCNLVSFKNWNEGLHLSVLCHGLRVLSVTKRSPSSGGDWPCDRQPAARSGGQEEPAVHRRRDPRDPETGQHCAHESSSHHQLWHPLPGLLHQKGTAGTCW